MGNQYSRANRNAGLRSPYYKIDEIVLIQSRDFPKWNGQTRILEVSYVPLWEQYCYRVCVDNGDYLWRESDIKKVYGGAGEWGYVMEKTKNLCQ